MSRPIPIGERRSGALYQAFGLTIASEIELPELLPCDGSVDGLVDVNIRCAKITDAAGDALDWKEGYRFDAGRLIATIPGAGRFAVDSGNRITVEPADGADRRRIRLLLLGTMFGALLMQRSILPIHGSAIVYQGRGVVLTGESGAGKSSLLAAFRQQGADFLTDDVSAIGLDSAGVAWLYPAYPQQKLWRDSATFLGIEVGGHVRVLPDHDKYAIPAVEGFSGTAIPLGFVCELQPSSCAEVSIRTLSPRELASTLIRQTFRRPLVRKMGRETGHFLQCVELSRRTRGLRMVRPHGMFSLDEQVRQLKLHVALDPAQPAHA